LFGELLAFQFAEWLGEQSRVQILEGGAHRGSLAKDILGWLRQKRPELFERIEYCIAEPSGRRRCWQERNLAEFAGQVRWIGSPAELTSGLRPTAGPGSSAGASRSIIFSNELLDAMPVRRFGWDARRRAWFEWGVTLEAGQFVWTRMASDCPVTVPAELLAVLPDGFTIETSPAAEAWWREAAGALASGKLLTIDYGLSEAELFMPERTEGTLRGYHRHRPAADILANPGEQDITAHVNFARIREIGEASGLKTEAFQSQPQFLTAIAARVWRDEAGSGGWTAERTRQFQTLTHPEHLGGAFRVLVQSRG
jgi:SAM-dependent MidA family methyltransferase